MAMSYNYKGLDGKWYFSYWGDDGTETSGVWSCNCTTMICPRCGAWCYVDNMVTEAYCYQCGYQLKGSPFAIDVCINGQEQPILEIPIKVKIKVGEDILVETPDYEDDKGIDLDLDVSVFLKPERVIFNGTTTKCFFADGTSTTVKLMEGDTYDKQKGIALCIAKRIMGGWTNFEELIENAEYYGGAKKD